MKPRKVFKDGRENKVLSFQMEYISGSLPPIACKSESQLSYTQDVPLDY